MLSERERNDGDRARHEHRYHDMMSRLCSVLCLDSTHSSSTEAVTARVRAERHLDTIMYSLID